MITKKLQVEALPIVPFNKKNVLALADTIYHSVARKLRPLGRR